MGDIEEHRSFKLCLVGLWLNFAATEHSAVRWSCGVYSLSMTVLFTVSALYHRPNWSPEKRMMMRRVDHAAIYGLISGTYTPLCMLLDEATGSKLLRLVWSGAVAGMIHSMFSRGTLGSKGLSVAIYITLGWIVVPYSRDFAQVLPLTSIFLLWGGGIFYSVGALMYACHWPDPSPTIFGYHEVFHCAVIVAAAFHFGGIVIALESKNLLAF